MYDKRAGNRLVAEIHLLIGRLAQLGEHLPYKQRVTGSSPVAPTTSQQTTLHSKILLK